MDFDYTQEQVAWREELRAFLRDELPPEMAGNSEFNEGEDYWAFAREFTRKVGERGWIGLTWPTRYGGQGRSIVDQLILSEEFSYADAPLLNMVGWAIAGGALLYAGTEEQKARFLPGILRFEKLWVEGLSEPDAGSDLASLTTRAVRDGDEWVIDGQKTFTTWGPRGDLIYLAARTDKEAPKHKGISLFCVDVQTPGVSFSPLDNIGGGRQNHTFLDSVRVSAGNMIGRPGDGWDIIMNAFYGGGMVFTSYMEEQRRLDEIVAHCQVARRNGRLLIDEPIVRDLIAEAALLIESQRLLTHETVSARAAGRKPPLGGALHAVVMKESMPRLSEIHNEILGPLAQLTPESSWAPLDGQAESWFRQSFKTHGGGTAQVKRMVLATRGLGLPR